MSSTAYRGERVYDGMSGRSDPLNGYFGSVETRMFFLDK